MDSRMSAIPGADGLRIVTVNLNLKVDTAECLRSFLAAGAAVEQIVVVDNGSTDGSEEYLRETFGDGLTILRSPENRGYADGVNQGIAHVMETSQAEWVLLVNNDTVVASDFLSILMTAAARKEHLLLGPAIFYMSQPDRIWNLGDHRIWGTFITRSPYREKRLPASAPKTLPVDFLNGCAMLVHRSVIERVGLLDTSFFMYAEEVDFCWRARKHGFSMAVIPQAAMWHKVSASSTAIRDVSLFYRTRNQAWFYRRYANIWQKGLMLAFTAARSLVWAARFLGKKKPALAKAIIRGWLRGWTGSPWG